MRSSQDLKEAIQQTAYLEEKDNCERLRQEADLAYLASLDTLDTVVLAEARRNATRTLTRLERLKIAFGGDDPRPAYPPFNIQFEINELKSFLQNPIQHPAKYPKIITPRTIPRNPLHLLHHLADNLETSANISLIDANNQNLYLR